MRVENYFGKCESCGLHSSLVLKKKQQILRCDPCEDIYDKYGGKYLNSEMDNEVMNTLRLCYSLIINFPEETEAIQENMDRFEKISKTFRMYRFQVLQHVALTVFRKLHEKEQYPEMVRIAGLNSVRSMGNLVSNHSRGGESFVLQSIS